MREDLRRRLREIGLAHSTRKNGVTGVTAAVTPVKNTLLHQPLHLTACQKDQSNQSCNTVTPVTPAKIQIGVQRYTKSGVTAGVTGRSLSVLQAEESARSDPEEWFAHFKERAAIREYEGGFDRAKAERLALAETIAALGPHPSTIH